MDAKNGHVDIVVSSREFKIVITRVHLLDIRLKNELKLLEHLVTELNLSFLDHNDSLEHLIEEVTKFVLLLPLLVDQLEDLIPIQFHLSVHEHEEEATKN